MNTFLLEVSTERHYAMLPSAFGSYKAALFRFMETRDASHVDRDNRICAFASFRNGLPYEVPSGLADFRKVDEYDGEDDKRISEEVEDVKRVHILRMTGPITRGGGECSYGSIEMRDMLMEAADRDDVVAHILYTRTPGGSVSSLIDFRKAIDYIHSKGKKIYMFCDGLVASAGVFIASMTDGIYCFNGEDEIGSIGLYSAFFALKSGAQNSITKETYVECYADRSTEKNRVIREASEGDLDNLKKENNELLDKLIDELKEDRPSILEEQMTGSMYKMKDVLGTMTDGICTLPELCEKAYSDWLESNRVTSAPGESSVSSKDLNSNKYVTMKEYNQIAKCAGYRCGEVMALSVSGELTLQQQEADALEHRLGEMAASLETLSSENGSMKEQLSSLNVSLAGMTMERDEARKELDAAREAMEKSVSEKEEEARACLQGIIDRLTGEKEALEAYKKEAEQSAKESEMAISERDKVIKEQAQVISDLQEQLAEANSGIGQHVYTGGSPSCNGGAATAFEMTSPPAWDSTKNASENKKALDEYLRKQASKQ